MPQATLDDVVMAIESLGSTADDVAKQLGEGSDLKDIKQSMFRIEELLERLVEALAPDAQTP